MFNTSYRQDGNDAIIQGQITYDGQTLFHIQNDICSWHDPDNGIYTYDMTDYEALMYIDSHIGSSEGEEFLEWLIETRR